MAKFEVTLAKAATYTDMGTGVAWKRGQAKILNEAEAARYKTNPKFLVKEIEAAKAKPKAKPAAEPAPASSEDGDDAPKAPAKKKVATKKKA